MNTATPPPPISPPPRKRNARWRVWTVIALVAVPSMVVAIYIPLRLAGLLRVFTVPSTSMAPAIAPGDRVVMEGFTFMRRRPMRGDIIVFTTAGMARVTGGSLRTYRIVGEPGEQLQITNGRLYVGNRHVTVRNESGEIRYGASPAGGMILFGDRPIEVPPGQFFVLGDNSQSSRDSRYWGFVPEENVLGRVWVRYWPPGRIGRVE